MLMITSFANPRVAQAFVDYMATQGIILTIQQHTQSDVWLADESQAGRVRAELARFLENPADPRYLAASWQSGQTNSGLRYQRFPFFATLRHNAGPFTWAILLICIAVFILQNLVGDQPVMIWLAWPYDPSLQFEAWRYFSHAFMHFSLMHILFNLLWWWYLGGAVEKRIGSGKLVVIAEKAMEKDTEARALRAIIEEFMLDIMYEIPKDENIGRVTITKEYIEGCGGPKIEIRSTETLPSIE